MLVAVFYQFIAIAPATKCMEVALLYQIINHK